jgi:hypothetical protein
LIAPENEARAFLAALRDTGRGACDRWVLAQGVDRDDAAAYQAAKERWQLLPLLSSPELRALALRVLLGALGRGVSSSDPFPSMLWPGGAGDTHGGKRFKGTLGDFVDRVLRARAVVVAEKRRGWVVCPTSNTDGHRVNASTTAVHAINLDCDGRGSYDALRSLLDAVGLAYIVYQSGGWSPTSQKWHILLPLDTPSDTSDPTKIDAHKRAYNALRVVMGALAELPGEGFDPTVETPCVPVFITERRSEADPPRQVFFREGRALNLRALVAALPEVPRDLSPRAVAADVEAEALSDARLEEITAALCAPMSKILSGRRDLYLCLAGALLDRGIAGDDMITIIEQISIRCPGDPSYTQKEVDDRHRQHVHDAETTVKKREEGGQVTRIGTLVERWPDVARAIDAVLPNPEWQSGVDWLDSLRSGEKSSPTSPAPRSQPVTPPPLSLSAVRAAVRKLRNRKLRNETFDQKIRGAILDSVLAGDDLVPRVRGRAVAKPNGDPYDRSSAIEAAVWSIVMSCDKDLLDAEALSILFRPSIARMLQEGEGVDQLSALVVSTFKLAAKRRRASEEERQSKDLQRSSSSQNWNWKER